jgi:tryptophan 2,3-dioxygenase
MSFAKPGTGETDYERYIRTVELLALQKRPDQLANDDELFFQSVHQAMEIWMKVAEFEVVKITRYLDGDRLQRAAHHLRRLSWMIDYLGDGLPILETMAQADYHEIRLALGRGSGQDSPGFNTLLAELPGLWAPFERMMERHGKKDLLAIFKDPHAAGNEPLFYVAQGFIDVDKSFQQFRYVHLQMARREIGLAVKSLKGVPARNLEQGILKPCFPELWKVIEDLTVSTNPVYG